MKKEESDRQLKLSEQDQDTGVVKKKRSKKKSKSSGRWVIFGVLFMTVILSLGFYLISSGVRSVGETKEDKIERVEELNESNGLFGSAVHEF